MDLASYEATGRAAYAELARVVGEILSAAVASRDDLRLQQIQHRAKDPLSLRRKLEYATTTPDADIESLAKDLAGVRLVFYTNSDVERFLGSRIITENFDVDWNRTKIHHPLADSKDVRELFISNNYVVRLKESRLQLPEYARLADLWCEVQVQTTLHHAWSEMAHDTIYKKPALAGFGGELMQSIEDRMDAIMRRYLIPAGYEFQKVANDFHRLSSGKELFDRGVFQAIDDATNNNDLCDLLENLADYVLPNYDDPVSIAGDVLACLARAVARSRTTPATPIETPFGSLPGYRAWRVASAAARIVDQLRYASIESTFETLAELFEGSTTDEERKAWLESAAGLAKNDVAIWQQAGPEVQIRLVRHICSLAEERRAPLRPLVLTILREALSPEVSGTLASSYNTITLQRGAVPFSEALREMRTSAIAYLAEELRRPLDDAAHSGIVGVLMVAASTPHMGQPPSNLTITILGDALTIVRLYTDMANALSFELLQKLEHDLLWTFRHDRNALDTDPPGVRDCRQELLDGILAFRDRINANRDFVVFKTLVGHNSVFPPAWENTELAWRDEEVYRQARVDELVAGISTENATSWLQTIRRCASTSLNDGLTFPVFCDFLEKLGAAQPAVVLSYLEQLDRECSRFLTAMLSGLATTGAWPQAEAIVRRWIEKSSFLGDIAWSFRTIRTLDLTLLQDVHDAALDRAEADAVLNSLAAAIARHDDARQDIAKRVLLSSIDFLGKLRDFRWVGQLAMRPRPSHNTILLDLEEAEARQILDQLVAYPGIDHACESIIAVLATMHPQAVLDWFGERMRFAHTERQPDRDRYEAVPYHVHEFKETLASQPASLLAAAYDWFKANRSFFFFEGGRLIHSAFPGGSSELERLLLERVDSGDRDEISFVLAVLGPYSGHAFVRGVCKEAVAVLPADDELLNSVSSVLDSMGVTSGEFGRVQGFIAKRAAIEPWLSDGREPVRTYAARYLHHLDLQIATEQRRADRDLALRKLDYGRPESEES